MRRYLLKNSTDFSARQPLLGAYAWQILQRTFGEIEVVQNFSNLTYPCILIEDAYPLLEEDDLRPLETALECGESLAVCGAYALQDEDDVVALYPTRNQEAYDSAMVYSRLLRRLQNKIIEGWQRQGVLFENPLTTRVDYTVTIGTGTRIYGENTLLGNTEIGENCTLYPGNFLRDATLYGSVELLSSTLHACTVQSHATVGPAAHLRPGTIVGENVRIGDFVELKNAVIGANTKIAHLAYVGDATVGQNCNFGCGAVVANFNGKTKHQTHIGDDCFIGCNVNLIAPISVGKGTFVAAGTTLSDSVAEQRFVIARPDKREFPKRKNQ